MFCQSESNFAVMLLSYPCHFKTTKNTYSQRIIKQMILEGVWPD